MPTPTACPVSKEREVLKALDPFWTRGIVKPEEGEG